MIARSLAALGFTLVACGGSPLVGTWKGNNMAVASDLIKAVDADVTFTATNATANITAKSGTNEKLAAITASGTYTSTDKEITLTLTSVTGTNNANAALATSSTATGLCVTLGEAICIPKSQTSAYTISGNELSTSIKTESGTVFPLKVTKQ